ncbi:TetR family transcriptional regulator [Staphylococcus saprophyticus]|uniref:TetR/AcrR family transcriptional regulator n=1 Tax=Staphylococcus saprophyticus TaxID=29385 RepID=UPI0022EB3748|nr:TetR family transcriptional regulator [Staphylococcus saprophyticus]MDW4407547.1 TetR family transcriptional regulator [Staphylococcus saprophyticus]MDW4453722.1 TetR family transcriptional regulator [Staphylococcus saprophyticus]MDW4488912.1 TetR family transcriptional regulator [Staphylococcus saprophyticus]MDW4517849.1 TetR family transcriptional regulator [Staphylococcus saprophyticus]MDW4559031.1 TetR family transcriptional regulator [Staphylococcus saprophyticus]
MVESKSDLRVIKTRKSIMQAFIKLSDEKDFKNITVKDIAQEALINRATFYYHFSDIYDLLDKVLAEELLINLNYEDFKDNKLNEETIASIFKAIAEFQLSLNRRYHRSYPETIGSIIQEHTERMLYKLLANVPFEDDSIRQLSASMLSASIYRASEKWCHGFSDVPAETYIQSVTPYIISGLVSRK